MPLTRPVNPVARHFLGSLAAAEAHSTPYRYWLLDGLLPEVTVDDVVALPFAPPAETVFDGRRESNNAHRVYFTLDAQAMFEVCKDVADAFSHPAVIAALEQRTGARLSEGRLRIEYCQDVAGFWLEPHTDISVKLFTMLIYLSGEPGMEDCGTDIYDDTPEHKLVARAPYRRNKGLIFIPGKTTWHGVARRNIPGVRRSLIINYVSPAWRDTWELA